MKKTASFVCALLVATPLVGFAQEQTTTTRETQTVIRTAPPAPIVEERPAAPYEHAVWIEGHYRWEGDHYVWVHGHFDRPPVVTETWVPGHWDNRDGAWVWTEGHWAQ